MKNGGWCGVAVAALVIAGCGEQPQQGVRLVEAQVEPASDDGSTATAGEATGQSWSEVVSARIAAGEYQLREQSVGTLGFTNRAHDLRAALDVDGFRVTPRTRDSDWELTVRTEAIGRGGVIQPVQAGVPEQGACSGAGEDERGECLHRAEAAIASGVVEWWSNDATGMRQGWEIAGPLAGDGPLTIEVAFEGFDAVVADDGLSAELIGDGVTLGYDDLKAWDATGRALAAQMVDTLEGVQLVVDVAEAVWPVTVDPLVTTPSWSTAGNEFRAYMGWSVSNAGDVNGDGFDDVIVGAPRLGPDDEGRALVYLGGASGLESSPGWTFDGPTSNARFGSSVSGAGDINGDGFDDILVGAPELTDGEFREGAAFFFLGSATGLSLTADWNITSNRTYGGLGSSVSDAGDVNGDGFDDVVVGANTFDNGEAGEGAVFLYLGSSTGLALTHAWSFESNQESAFLGRSGSVSTAGDVNGDGFDDLVVGASNFDEGQANEGKVFAFLGSPTGPSGTPDWTTQSNQSDANLGAVASAGDVNGDGFDDVVVGAPFYDAVGSNEGRAEVYLGSALGLENTPVWTANSGQTGGTFGHSVSAAGDVNGDGLADLLVGAPFYDAAASNEGRAYLYLGSLTGPTSPAAWIFDADTPSSYLGYSVSKAGDVNADGLDDVLVGAYRYTESVSQEGAAFVFLAGPALSAAALGPYNGNEGTPVDLDASNSTGATIYRWDCTDDGSYDVTGVNASCTYPDQGTYTVRLQVENGAGDTDEDTATVTIDNVDPIVDAGPDQNGVPENHVTIAGSATDVAADPLTLQADCDDGAGLQPVGSANFTCTYTSTGTYTVTLQADDGDGGISSDTTTVNISTGSYCTPGEWLCDTMPAFIAVANSRWGSDVIDDSAALGRLRPETIFNRLDALATQLEDGGCVVDRSSLDIGSGAFRGQELDGGWSNGAVTGSFGPARAVQGQLENGPAFGDTYGRHNNVAQVVTSREDGGFVAGHHARVDGRRGVWFMFTGTCDAGATPSEALSPWWSGPALPSW